MKKEFNKDTKILKKLKFVNENFKSNKNSVEHLTNRWILEKRISGFEAKIKELEHLDKDNK
jgi:hypothetical protein